MKNVQRCSPVAASSAMMRPCPPASPLASPTNTWPRANNGAVVTDSPICGGTLPTRSVHTISPVSWRSAATSALLSPTKMSPAPKPTPCQDGTLPASALADCQRQTVSPVRASIANTLAPAVR